MVGWVVRGGWISFDCCILKFDIFCILYAFRNIFCILYAFRNVSTVNFDCKLKAIALQARNAEYSPKVQVF
ncbi:hypothetical protein HanRHA438_Chr10g0461341 [Helianthus annuus]|nr:hypothetical protein HanRHA438_Chr10g0461341 [Helianthus annuus]